MSNIDTITNTLVTVFAGHLTKEELNYEEGGVLFSILIEEDEELVNELYGRLLSLSSFFDNLDYELSIQDDYEYFGAQITPK